MTESDDIQIISEPESIQKQIAALNYSIKLLKKRRDELHRKLYINDWEENEFAQEKRTSRTAKFFYGLNYLISSLKKVEENESDPEYAIAKQIWNFHEVAVPFIKKIADSKGQANFTYSTEHLESGKENDLFNLCTRISERGWIKFERQKSGLKIEKLSECNNDFLTGYWAECVNRFLIQKAINEFAFCNNVRPHNVFWNVKLKEVGSKEGGNDMELDIVVELKDRFYIFETKAGNTGNIDWKKMLERTTLFNKEKSRFILCSLDQPKNKKNESLLIFPLPQFEEKLSDLLLKDFANENTGTV